MFLQSITNLNFFGIVFFGIASDVLNYRWHKIRHVRDYICSLIIFIYLFVLFVISVALICSAM